MYGTYYKRNKKTRQKLFSSFIPILFLLIVGGIVGGTLIKSSDKKENDNIVNQNSIQNNQINTENQNLIQNNNEENKSDENSQNIDNEPKNEQRNETNSNSTVSQVVFDDTVAFIGDSRTQGLILYNGLKKVQDYSYIGLAVDTAVTKKFIKNSNGEEITLLEDMKSKNIKSVYIMLGVNELGWSYPQVFKVKYKELIEEIKKVKPDCKIYIQSIIPMTKSKSDSDKIFNNKNVAEFNKLIQEVAKEENVTYLDVQSALVDNQGYLPEDASTDGIHLDVEYCEKWLDYLKNNS